MSHLDQFMDEFTHVADILRYGNHLIFLKELEELNVLEEKLESQIHSVNKFPSSARTLHEIKMFRYNS